MSKKEVLIQPQFEIDPNIDGADFEALSKIQQSIESNPEFVKSAIQLFDKEPEIVSSVIEFLRNNIESLPLIDAWRKLITEKLDSSIVFDDGTESAIQSDLYFQSTKREFNTASPDKLEKLRNKLRSRRWSIFIDRTTAA